MIGTQANYFQFCRSEDVTGVFMSKNCWDGDDGVKIFWEILNHKSRAMFSFLFSTFNKSSHKAQTFPKVNEHHERLCCNS